MTIYAVFDENGMPAAFYSTDLHTEIPEGAVEVTSAQWRDLIDNPGARRWQGGAVVAYTPPPAPPPVPDEIEFRQLIIGALMEGWISPSEAEAWAARNELPAVVLDTIALLPAQQQPIARITALTRERIQRTDPLIAAAAALRMPDATDAQRTAEGDRLFRAWAAI